MSAVNIPAWLDASAVAVGSISGILVARERKLDLVGYVALAMLGGLGGGLVRDVIIQRGGVYMLDSPYAIPMAVVFGCIGFLFPTMFDRFPHLLEWVDIVSVGLFVAAGTDKAMIYNLSPWAVILMGTLTGVGGGMMRDVFLGDTPRIFQRSNLYAICAIVGSALYYVLILYADVTRPWTAIICVLAVVLLRRASLRFGIYSPSDVNLGPAVSREARAFYHIAQDEGRHQSQRIVRRLNRKTKDSRFVLVREDIVARETERTEHKDPPRRSSGEKGPAPSPEDPSSRNGGNDESDQ